MSKLILSPGDTLNFRVTAKDADVLCPVNPVSLVINTAYRIRETWTEISEILPASNPTTGIYLFTFTVGTYPLAEEIRFRWTWVCLPALTGYSDKIYGYKE